MLTTNSRSSFVLPIAATFVAVAFGLAAAILPFQIQLVFVFLVGFCVLVWVSPWTAFPIYVIVSMLSPDYKISDLLTLLVMAIVLLGAATRRQLNLELPRKLTLTLAIFFGIIGIQLVVGKLYLSNSWPLVYRDGRIFLYWLWIPVLYFSYSKHPSNNQDKLLRSIIAVAIAIASLALVQAATGWQLSGVGRVRDLGIEDSTLAGFTRVQMPGFLFVTFAAVWATVALRYGTISLWIAVPLLALFAGGLVVNYGRGLWFWTAVAFLLSVVFVDRSKVISYFVMLLCALLICLTVVAFFKPVLLESIINRVVSVQFEGGSGTSYGWRELENRDGLLALRQSPFIGVGIGGEYRTWISRLRNFEEHTRYVHNSYLFIALKLGIPGLIILLGMLWKSWRLVSDAKQRCEPSGKVMLITWLATFPSALGLSITQPELMSSPGVGFFAILIALALLGERVTSSHKSSLGAHVALIQNVSSSPSYQRKLPHPK